MDIFVDTLPDDTYTLRILSGKLISLKYIRPADEFDSLTKPERAIWAVPGLRQMQILLDETQLQALAKFGPAKPIKNYAGLVTGTSKPVFKLA